MMLCLTWVTLQLAVKAVTLCIANSVRTVTGSYSVAIGPRVMKALLMSGRTSYANILVVVVLSVTLKIVMIVNSWQGLMQFSSWWQIVVELIFLVWVVEVLMA